MIHAMIMAGGKGSRFWPMSRLKKAKQFLSILGDSPLLDYTINRIAPLIDNENCWLLANNEQSQYLDAITSVQQNNILREPFGKNTAACIVWGAFEALKRDPEAILVNISADAWISNQKGFETTILKAIEEVRLHNSLVTIGIRPRSAHTGYGYIETSSKQGDVYSVKSFTEKPDAITAESYYKNEHYFWNAGIFVWKASRLLELINEHMPTHYKQLKKMTDQTIKDPNNVATYYSKLDPLSIDYGLLEKIGPQISLVPAEFEWDDIGSWSSLEPYLEKDAFQNAIRGKAITYDSHRNIIFSNKKLIALCHVNDCIIVDTDDALLIVPKKFDQDIKHLYNSVSDDYK
jgi:mannose-1-phosphate guanylyltransferase